MRRPLSIRQWLLIGLLGAVLLLFVISTVAVYYSAQHEVAEIYDANLSREAHVLATLMHHEAQEKDETRRKLFELKAELGADAWQNSRVIREMIDEYAGGGSGQEKDPLSLLLGDEPGHPYELTFSFRVHSDDGATLLSSPKAPVFDDRQAGFSVQYADGKPWRAFSLHVPDAQMLVQVAEETEVRDEIIEGMLLSVIWPGLVALPLLSLVIWLVVGRGLAPLHRLARKLERRAPDSLVPFATHSKPQEVLPMVHALNRLFERVHKAMDNERRFTSNAAHELRTPLAALKVHAQTLKMTLPPELPQTDSIDEIITGVDRATHLLEQLLALARADSSGGSGLQLEQQVDMQQVAVQVLEGLGHLAVEKDIELSFDWEGGHRAQHGDPAALTVLVRNLVDNAIRYTPHGGHVSIRLHQLPKFCQLTVSDDGPGIPESQREQLFERFQRGETQGAFGSGLGLSIVRQVAEAHGADVSLDAGELGKGLRVTVMLPQAPDSVGQA